MFLRADDLKLSYGVDLEIGRFYVNKMVPVDNAYWKSRHLYIPPVPGFMFMPIMADLARRAGISTIDLLSSSFIDLAESILDSAARLEMRQIDWLGHVDECLIHAGAVCQHPQLLSDLTRYLQADPSRALAYDGLGTPYPSLNRADTYLLAFVALSFDDVVRSNLLEAWYALMTHFLLQDDLSDIREDLRNHEENALLDAGLSDDGARKIRGMIQRSFTSMSRINPVLANRIEYADQSMDIEELIRKIREEELKRGS